MDDLLRIQISCPFWYLTPNLFQCLHFIFLKQFFVSLNSQSLLQICSFAALYEVLMVPG